MTACHAVQVERVALAAGGNPAALAAARKHLGNHHADRRQWAQVKHANPKDLLSQLCLLAKDVCMTVLDSL